VFGAGGARGHGGGGVEGAGQAGLEAAEDHGPGALHERGLGGSLDQLVHLDVRSAAVRLDAEVGGHLAAGERGASPADTLANFESVLTSVKHPPGPTVTWLGETIVHSEDIRRALGITHAYPVDAVVAVAGFYQGSNLLIGSKNRIAGLALRATDAGWSHGTGPEVKGPVLSHDRAHGGR
jgi:hypothetical protein